MILYGMLVPVAVWQVRLRIAIFVYVILYTLHQTRHRQDRLVVSGVAV